MIGNPESICVAPSMGSETEDRVWWNCTTPAAKIWTGISSSKNVRSPSEGF